MRLVADDELGVVVVDVGEMSKVSIRPGHAVRERNIFKVQSNGWFFVLWRGVIHVLWRGICLVAFWRCLIRATYRTCQV